MPRFNRNLILVALVDVGLFVAAWVGAFYLRFNFIVPEDGMQLVFRSLPLVVAVELAAFYLFDLYRGMWRYTSLEDLFNVIKATTTATLLLALAVGLTHGLVGFARAVFVINWGLVLLLASGCRVGIRVYFGSREGGRSGLQTFVSIFARGQNGKKDVKKLLIVGAGDSGEKIYREIRDNHRLKYAVVGFLDDDPDKIGRQIHGVPVLGSSGEIAEVARRKHADETLIAIPSASAEQMRTIVDACKKSGIPFKTLPGMGELIDGKVTVQAIREVAYRDLLGREVVRLDERRIGGYLENTVVMVTGAGGSIGSELCRQICRYKPEALVLFERAESALYDIELELKKNFPYVRILPVLADIRDTEQLTAAFEAHRPRCVFHAAAYKHVPIIELHPWQGVRNNVLGTRNLVAAANRFGVERFVFVSTDKAVRPTNVMGASKRVAELVVQGQNACAVSATRYITVRFGNVVGSVGSVIPLFKKQIAEGGPVTVTHPEVTRYFMTIPEACQLILQAGSMGEGGEIFLLDMGVPIKIVDMARDLIRLSGFEPDRDIRVEFIGLRPGEKLYEELITEGEGIQPTTHEKIMVLRGQSCDQRLLNGQIDRLGALARAQDDAGIRRLLNEILPEYRPSHKEVRG